MSDVWFGQLAAVAEGLATIEGLQVVNLLDKVVPVRPPAAVLLAPSFTFDAPGGASRATTTVVIVESPDAFSPPKLMAWVEPVADAVDAVRGAATLRAFPSTWTPPGQGSKPLPAYLLEIAL